MRKITKDEANSGDLGLVEEGVRGFFDAEGGGVEGGFGIRFGEEASAFERLGKAGREGFGACGLGVIGRGEEGKARVGVVVGDLFVAFFALGVVLGVFLEGAREIDLEEELGAFEGGEAIGEGDGGIFAACDTDFLFEGACSHEVVADGVGDGEIEAACGLLGGGTERARLGAAMIGIESEAKGAVFGLPACRRVIDCDGFGLGGGHGIRLEGFFGHHL